MGLGFLIEISVLLPVSELNAVTARWQAATMKRFDEETPHLLHDEWNSAQKTLSRRIQRSCPMQDTWADIEALRLGAQLNSDQVQRLVRQSFATLLIQLRFSLSAIALF
jgi:hypothetical protein